MSSKIPDSISTHKEIQNRCELCDSIFETPQELAAHLYFSFSLDSDALHYFLTSRSIKPFAMDLKRKVKRCMASLDSGEDLFKCPTCKKVLKNARGLSQHLGKVHSRELKCHRCWNCGKKFKSKYALKMHVNQVHKKSTLVKCEVCSLDLYNKYIKNQHMKKVHGLNISY